MKYVSQLLLTFVLILGLSSGSFAAKHETRQVSALWIKQALHYGFAMQTHDYHKYMSTKYIEHIDGKTFNFSQWIHHMETLKNMMKSYRLKFDEVVVDGNKIAASYRVFATKKNGDLLVIRVIAIFKIEQGKIVYCDELTHLLSGPGTDKTLSSHS